MIIDKMDGNVIPHNMRVPEELVAEIEHNIEEYGFHNTRPDFIIDSMRILMKKILVERINLIGDAETPNQKIINQSILKMSLKEREMQYLKYKGKSTQIMLRIPKGLYESILEYKLVDTPFKNLNEFIRISIITGLEYYKDLVKMKDPDKYLDQDESDSNEACVKLVELIQNGESNFELMSFFTRNFAKEHL